MTMWVTHSDTHVYNKWRKVIWWETKKINMNFLILKDTRREQNKDDNIIKSIYEYCMRLFSLLLSL